MVFLDAEEQKYVEELGGMNLYFVHDDGHIVTPATGTILEGITRASIIELAGKLGHQVEERRFSIDEWRDGVASGAITEVFACGTAAVVTPGRRAQVGRRRGAGDADAGDRSTHADPPGPGRRPVRPRRGHLRLDAPGRLTPRRARRVHGQRPLTRVKAGPDHDLRRPRLSSVSKASRRCSQKPRNLFSQASTSASGPASIA